MRRTVLMCCSFILLLSCSLFLLCSEHALYFLQPWGRALVTMGNLLQQPPPPPPPPFSSVCIYSSVVEVSSLYGSKAALFIFLVLSTSSPCDIAFRTLVRVRGEDIGHFSSVSLNVTPPLIHMRVIKAGWGIFPEKLFSR